MTKAVIFNPTRVLAFINERQPLAYVPGMKGIGLEEDGKLIAGVAYEGFNGSNVWMHVAAVPGARWMTREYLTICFAYPFNQLGVRRVSGYVEANNTAARRFDEHLGFKPEATLKGAGKNDGDVLIYCMRREDCRYVQQN